MALAQSTDLGLSQYTVTAPTKGAASCQGAPQGTALKGTFYFLPKPGDTPAIVSYTPTSKQWDTIPISAPVTGMLKGGTLTAVAAADAGAPDFLVVSGGGSKNVIAYNVQVTPPRTLVKYCYQCHSLTSFNSSRPKSGRPREECPTRWPTTAPLAAKATG